MCSCTIKGPRTVLMEDFLLFIDRKINFVQIMARKKENGIFLWTCFNAFIIRKMVLHIRQVLFLLISLYM